MDVAGTALLVGGALVLLGIASSTVSARVGLPVLVLFLGLGMLAGSEGLGGIPFEDYELANVLGSAALALILFDGGLRTPMASVRAAWCPALVLSTAGVALTALVTGLAAAWALGLPLAHGILLGAIVGSTDAAAVFASLRASRQRLPERLAATLEMESGSNDPMAIFLVIGLVEVLTAEAVAPGALLLLFVQQFGLGALVGLGAGRAAAWVVNRMRLTAAGLYPVLVTGCGVLTFGLTTVLGGSGFLAVYLTGIVLGNSDIVFRRGILLFHDAVAWLSQIALFVMLGLLSFPSRLPAVALEGLVVAAVLILVARPLAVVLSLWPFRFRPTELAFLSWVGLKGAVPITLATFPLMAGLEGGMLLFDLVFFVVIVSALTQGWTLPAVARWLGLAAPAPPAPPVSVELNALQHVDADVVEYTVAPSSRVAEQALRDVVLPDGVVVAVLVRRGEVIMPRGGTHLLPGDHVFVAVRRDLVPLIDRLFDPEAGAEPLPAGLTLAFHGATTLGQLHRFFGLPAPEDAAEPIGSYLPGSPDAPPVRVGPFVVAPSDDPDYVTLTYVGAEAEQQPVGEATRPAAAD